MELDLTGLQMPSLPEQPKPNAGRRSGRWSGASVTRSATRCGGSSCRGLRGTAVWAFRTDGVLHEHQTIPGVVEDVHQIIHNLKGLVLKMDDDVDEAVLELRATKAGSVTARAIREHASVQVVNPDHHILELQEDRDFRMELYVNKGRGFVLAEQHPIPRGMPADLVRVDAIYNPVRRANFVVEETRVGQRTDFDRLVLEVETDGVGRRPEPRFSTRPAWRSSTSAIWRAAVPSGRDERQLGRGRPRRGRASSVRWWHAGAGADRRTCSTVRSRIWPSSASAAGTACRRKHPDCARSGSADRRSDAEHRQLR